MQETLLDILLIVFIVISSIFAIIFALLGVITSLTKNKEGFGVKDDMTTRKRPNW